LFILTSLRIIGRAIMQFNRHGGTQMGAALAYYALFSTAPLLVLAVMLAKPFFGEGAAEAQVEFRLTEILGRDNAQEIKNWMDHRVPPSASPLAATLGIAFLLAGTLGAFLHLRGCLCVIWDLQPPRGSTLLMTVLNYLLALATVFCVGLLLTLCMVASALLELTARLMGDESLGGPILWRVLDAGVAFLLLTLFFAIIYQVLSGGQIRRSYVFYGAILSALLFLAGKLLISLYLALTNPSSIYGVAGSLVVFLVWVFYSAQIAFFGAEIIQARRTRAEWMTKPGTTAPVVPSATPH
jgi:membrane protein